jgi:hypothetical protein
VPLRNAFTNWGKPEILQEKQQHFSVIFTPIIMNDRQPLYNEKGNRNRICERAKKMSNSGRKKNVGIT